MGSSHRPARSGLRMLAISWLASAVSANQKFTSTPANFRGFHLYPNGAVETITCGGSATFFTSSTYAACCNPTDRCNFATACVDGTASRIFGGTYTCDTEYPACLTMTIYASYPSASESWLFRGCAVSTWKPSTVYREVITDSSSAPTSSSSGAKPTPTPTNSGGGDDNGGAGAITSGPTALPTNTAPSDPTTAASPSQAWIAGAVIGPVAALGILGYVAFWLGTRKGRKSALEPEPSQAGGMSVDPRASLHPGPAAAGGQYGYYGPNGENKQGLYVSHDGAVVPVSGSEPHSPNPGATYAFVQQDGKIIPVGAEGGAAAYPGQYGGQHSPPPPASTSPGLYGVVAPGPTVQGYQPVPAQLPGSESTPDPAELPSNSYQR